MASITNLQCDAWCASNTDEQVFVQAPLCPSLLLKPHCSEKNKTTNETYYVSC